MNTIIVLRGSNGMVQGSMALSKLVLLMVMLVAVTLSLLGWAFWNIQSSRVILLEADVVDSLRESLVRHQEELDWIKQKSHNVTKTLVQQLGPMQARLLRLEALGQHISEIVDLDVVELNFDEPPALGGPDLNPHSDFGLSHVVNNLMNEIARRENQLELLEELLRERRRNKTALPIGWPVEENKGWLSSRYGPRIDPFTGRVAMHKGIDFAGRMGWPVVAAASGVVTYAGYHAGYGLFVEINHGNSYVTRYGHHSELLVNTGDVVKAGTVIAAMGRSGRSTGPHVHYEILKDNKHINPERLSKLKRR